MRNLKKLFAVVMTVAMLASLMVPALAADSFKYEAEAKKLYDLGLFQGNSATSYEPDLGTSLNRQAGLALAIRLMGKDAEVDAMTAEEISTQLAKIVDADEITEWAKPYAAYAVKNGLTNGIDANILPNVKFGAQLDLTGKEFIYFVLKAMGYQVAWDDVLTKAAAVGMLSAGDAVTFGTTAVLNRDSAVGIMASALGGTTSAGVVLAQALVDAGAVSAEATAEAGFLDPSDAPTEAPEELTFTASTDNLVQIYVEFDREVDKDSAEDEDNYSVTDSEVKNASLQDDGVTVILTLKEGRDQQDVADLTIKNVKDIDGNAINETTIEVDFLDTTIPSIVDASVAGKNTFKVILSEPVNPDEVDESAVTVKDANDSKIFVKEIKLQNNNTEALISLYSTLKEGEISLSIGSKTFEDYAQFSVIGKSFDLLVTPDEEDPVVVGYESAKRGEVVLVWNEDIVIDATLNEDGELVDAEALEDYYHTNSKNKASKVTKDGNKMTLTFEEDEWLPAGTAYVYVGKEAVKDLWDNKNAQQMIKVEVEVDSDAPEVDSLEVDKEDKITVKYTEKLKGKTAEDEDNYTLLDDKGKEVENIISTISYDNDKKVTINFYETLSGDYTLIIEDVEDVYGNKMPETNIDFNVGDKTDPEYEDFEAIVYKPGVEGQMLKVSFGEKMATEGKYSVNDLEKYFISGAALADVDDVKIKVVDDGKAVEITIPHDELEIDPANDFLTITRVADAAGNYTPEPSSDYVGGIEIKTANVITLTAEATGAKTIKIKFSDNVVKFDQRDISVVSAVYDELKIAEFSLGLDKDKTVATLTMAKEMKYDLSDAVFVKVDGTRSENTYGVKLDQGTFDVEDKISPKVDEILFLNADSKVDAEEGYDYSAYGDADDSLIVLTYTETLRNVNAGNYAHDLVVYNKKGDKLTAAVDYTTVVNGKDLIVIIEDVEDLAKFTIEPDKDIEYIQDLKENLAESFDKERN